MLKRLGHALKPEPIPCSIKCAGTKAPALSDSERLCPPQRRGKELKPLRPSAFAINTPATMGMSCQGLGRTFHGPSKPHTAVVQLSLPTGSQQVFLVGQQNQQVEGCCGGQDVPRPSGFSPPCLLCCDGSTNTLTEATSLASALRGQGQGLVQNNTSVVALKDR